MKSHEGSGSLGARYVSVHGYGMANANAFATGSRALPATSGLRRNAWSRTLASFLGDCEFSGHSAGKHQALSVR